MFNNNEKIGKLVLQIRLRRRSHPLISGFNPESFWLRIGQNLVLNPESQLRRRSPSCRCQKVATVNQVISPNNG